MSTYSFLNATASISGPGGAFSIGSGAGVAEEGLTVAMTEEKNTMTVGADGSVMHSLHGGRSGKVTVRLLKTSPVNAQLNALYNFQTVSSTNHGQNTITVTDAVRGDVITCTLSAFLKAPDINYEKEGKFLEWEFHVGVVNEMLGAGTWP